MTFQKPTPANPRHLHSAAQSDHLTQLNCHEFKQSSRACTERVTQEARRCSSLASTTPSTKENSKKEKDKGKVRVSEASWTHNLMRSHCLGRSYHESAMTPESLTAYLTPAELECLRIEATDLKHLWSASLDPPVTKVSLSELDLSRIMNDAKLRHDLNFEREVAFRPNMYGSKGRQKLSQAKEYWDALVIELALYMRHWHRLSSTPSNPSPDGTASWPLSPSFLHNVPWRLPRLFQTIREILKTLVPDIEWSALDDRLDIDLVMQELDKGACDLTSLSNWLGSLLLGSCSPLRDPMVSSMITAIQQGVAQDDAHALVGGLRALFGVLETMKLDVANHQIRYLRLLMIDDTVHFEQKFFLGRISNGWDLTEARIWYQSGPFEGDFEEQQIPEPRLAAFTRNIIEMVITTETRFPITFIFDNDRLRSLQADFRICMHRAICGQLFIDTLQSIGWIGLPPPDSYDDLLGRILVVKEREESQIDGQGHVSAVTLEIVRAAYSLCGDKNLPNGELLDDTERSLRDSLDPNSAIYEELEGYLCSDLGDLLDQELRTIYDMTPLQILNHFHPGRNVLGSAGEHTGLLSIAKRIAHMTILHWRVWAPILYEQPCDAGSSTPNSSTDADDARELNLASADSVMNLIEDAPRDTLSRNARLACNDDGRESSQVDSAELKVEATVMQPVMVGEACGVLQELPTETCREERIE